MKRLALALALLAPMPASADITCVLFQKNGTSLIYNFQMVATDIAAEVSMTRDGVTTSSQVGKRPPWRVYSDDDVFMLHSVRDPNFAIVMRQQLERHNGVLQSDALLRRKTSAGKVVDVAVGSCGFAEYDPPRAPEGTVVPEQGV